MLLKKTLIIATAAAAALGMSSALAAPKAHHHAKAHANHNAAYAEANFAWSQTNWKDFSGGAFSGLAPHAITKNGKNGFAGGVDLGYQFNHFMSAEAGWVKLPTVKGTVVDTDSHLSVSSWFAYMAAKVAVPVMTDISLFGKAGLAVRQLNYSGSAMSNPAVKAVLSNDNYWAPYFAVGAQMSINKDWTANVQYSHVSANDHLDELHLQAPGVNLVSVGVGYKFSV